MKGLRLSEGGWVLIVAACVIAALLVWALAPALLRMTERPPGDGRNPSSYGFDIEDPRLPAAAPLQAALLHRDMVPVLESPPVLLDAAEASKQVSRKGPFLTSNDLVIGAVRGGAARAWPLLLLNVHEVLHDDLGGPLLVSWHWPSGAVAVYDTTVEGTPRRFGVSGLVAGGGQLLYLRHDDGGSGGEPLLSQFTGESISGEPITLEPIPHVLTTWGRWKAQHPGTTVAGPEPAMTRRYKSGKPDTYFRSEGMLFDVPVPDDGPPAKSPALLLERDGERRTVTVDDFAGKQGPLEIRLGTDLITLELADEGRRIEVDAPDEVVVRRGLWHLVHAMAH